MCGIKQNQFVKNFSSGCVRPLVCLVFLLLAALPLQAADWAFLKKEEVQVSQVSVAEETKAAQKLENAIEPEVLQGASEQHLTKSTISSKANSDEWTGLLNNLENKLGNSILVSSDLKTEFQNLKNSLETYKETEDAEDKLTEYTINVVSKLEEEKANLSENLIKSETLLKKAKSSKAFARINGVMGFESNIPTLGIGGALGARLGDGLILELGANYMLGKFNEFPKLELGLDNLTMSVGIGWEW